MYKLLIILILAILSFVSVFNPRLSWKIQQGWKFKNAEPSKSYLLAIRIAGIVGIIVCFCLFFQS